MRSYEGHALSVRGGPSLYGWLFATALLLAAAVLSLFTGMEVRDPAAAEGEISRRDPVECGSVLGPARWSEEKWTENGIAWRTRVCDNARITRLGWTGIFLTGGLAVLVTGLGVNAWQRSRSSSPES
ncbi:hypothetical protein [Streptomyces sp. NPDC048172]|uniref:hypothetical protein n=1 Tax=Streptomyces sp. NPDC048172 TaxID=3365505 RepID=UPI00371AB78D